MQQSKDTGNQRLEEDGAVQGNVRGGEDEPLRAPGENGARSRDRGGAFSGLEPFLFFLTVGAALVLFHLGFWSALWMLFIE